MNRSLVQSAVFAVGLHAVLMSPLRSAGGTVSAWTDVAPGVNSLEVDLAVFNDESVQGPAREKEETAAGEGELLPPTGSESKKEFEISEEGAWSSTQEGLLRNPAPRYPKLARLKGWEGTVLLQLWVTPLGTVGAARVARSSGHAVLDDSALTTVRQWRFRAAQRAGTSVGSEVEIPITFKLNEAKTYGAERW